MQLYLCVSILKNDKVATVSSSIRGQLSCLFTTQAPQPRDCCLHLIRLVVTSKSWMFV